MFWSYVVYIFNQESNKSSHGKEKWEFFLSKAISVTKISVSFVVYVILCFFFFDLPWNKSIHENIV